MRPREDLISVIIPHLNQADHLRRCLSSLQNQNNMKYAIEIIVVDNGSIQLPRELCKSFDKVRLVQEVSPGPGPARNKGIAVSNGLTLAFIDADCIADPDWLAEIGGLLGQDGIHQIIGGDVRIALADPERMTMLEAYESIFAYRQRDYIERMGFSGTGNLAMRREYFDKVGPFAGIDLAEDRDWGRRAVRAGYIITYVPEMIVFHPARKTMKELHVKWDRHIDHDFEEYEQKRFGNLKWALYSLAVAISPVIAISRIAASPRVPDFRGKYLATWCLIAIRMYRFKRMILRIFAKNQSSGNRTWNRK